eukprot:scaffold114_cov361-Pinguiococcus_pyrenoidosus.AAC.42
MSDSTQWQRSVGPVGRCRCASLRAPSTWPSTETTESNAHNTNHGRFLFFLAPARRASHNTAAQKAQALIQLVVTGGLVARLRVARRDQRASPLEASSPLGRRCRAGATPAAHSTLASPHQTAPPVATTSRNSRARGRHALRK